MLESYFRLKENGTTVRVELVAGLTTFLTMAYIIFVNPMIMSKAGMDQGAAFVATCLSAAFASALMGLWARYPVALAPGMGLNAYFTYGVVLGMGHTWQVGLGAVFLSGCLFLIISVLPIREKIVNAIPMSQKMAIGAGIGLFLAIIALENANIVVAHPATIVTLGKIGAPAGLLACLGFVLIVALDYRKIPGSIMIAILAITVIGIIAGVSKFNGLVSAPPSLGPTFLQLDIPGALSVGLVSIVFAFFMVDLFDNTGTLISIAPRAGMMDADGKLKRIGPAFISDSVACMVGAALGTSTVTSYIESAAGIRAGGRTGLTAVVVAVLFLLSIFIAPLATSIPAFATAPALFFVACVMAGSMVKIDWEDVTEYAPAVVTMIAMPLTFSIATGIALGFIAYVVSKLLAGRIHEVSFVMILLAIAFVAKLAFA